MGAIGASRDSVRLSCPAIPVVKFKNAKTRDGTVALLVDLRADGTIRRPVRDLVGCRGAGLADLYFQGVAVPGDCMIGQVGFGLSPVADSALMLGRLGVAWGAAGLMRACFDEALGYVEQRRQFGKRIFDNQVVQGLLADMTLSITASRLLCREAAQNYSNGTTINPAQIFAAKFFATRAATQVAGIAVQLQGAHGCSKESIAQLFFRDAKTMEVVEGPNEMLRPMIGQSRLAYLFDDC